MRGGGILNADRITIRSLMLSTGLSRVGIIYRLNALGISKNYVVIDGRSTRIFTDDEKKRIINNVSRSGKRFYVDEKMVIEDYGRMRIKDLVIKHNISATTMYNIIKKGKKNIF